MRVPKSPQLWRRFSTSGAVPKGQNTGAATQVTIPEQTRRQILPPGLDPMPQGTIMYPGAQENNQWLQQFNLDSPLPSNSGRKQGVHPARERAASSADERELCCECGHQKHNQKDVRDRNIGLPTPPKSYDCTPPGTGLGAPTASHSSLVRDHGIDLTHMVPLQQVGRVNSRRDSMSGPFVGGGGGVGAAGPPHALAQGLKAAFPGANAFARIPEQSILQHSGVEEKGGEEGGGSGQYDVLRREEFEEEGLNCSPGTNVTKVVVIYMQEKRLPRSRTDQVVGSTR
ncbi:hypothetical protein N0V82_008247 [Gnomoniopsis sp. IMI 355080]|nr:hypothetical protein N0V82_008247 [Gnomoniopsis sp. IMI 355080]